MLTRGRTMKEGLAELLFGYRGGDYGLQPVAMVINIFITPVYAHSNLRLIRTILTL